MSKILLEKAIKQYIYEIIDSIHINYPRVFTKELKQEWYQKIKINIQPIDEKLNKKIKTKVAKYYLKKRYFNTGISIERKSKYSDSDRCISRVWGNGKIIYSENETIYGNRCSRKKIQGCEYCHSHSKNNAHGDFNIKPSNKIICNFLKHKK